MYDPSLDIIVDNYIDRHYLDNVRIELPYISLKSVSASYDVHNEPT